MMDKVVMKEKLEATIDLLQQLLADFAAEAETEEAAPAKNATKKKEAAPAKEATKAKGKAKPAPEPEPEEEAEEEEEEESLTLEDLQEMDLAGLKKVAAETELVMPKKVTKATLLKAFEEQFFSEEEEDAAEEEEDAAEEEEEVAEEPAPKKKGKAKAKPEPELEPEDDEEDEEVLTAEDINQMSLAELKKLVKENELEVPAAALKNVNKLREALIELIEAEDEEEEEEDFEASAERLEAEAEVEAQIRQQLKGKKLNAAKMKKFLADYQEGNPDCEDCGNCSTEELTDCYIQTKQALVDDEGEVHEASDLYLRNGINHCCGAPLQEDGTCAICGSEWE